MTGVKYDYNFLAGAYVDDRILFNSYNLSLHLYVNTFSEIDQQVAFTRMDVIIDDFINNAVFISEYEDEAITRLAPTEINLITMDVMGPTDHAILITLVTKLNIILAEKLIIFESELSSIRGHNVRYIYTVDESAESLIGTSKTKWWNNNLLQFNNGIFETTNSIYEFNKFPSWKELSLQWEEDQDELGELDTPRKPATIVNFNEN